MDVSLPAMAKSGTQMPTPVAYLEIWKGGAARIFGDLFLGRRPTSRIPVPKNFDDLFYFF
jgi:hypothetical protein